MSDMEHTLVNIGKQLKLARQKRELTLQQVAVRTGVSAGLISKIENLRTTPSLPVLLKIMQTLNIDLSELDLTPNNYGDYILIKKGQGTKEEREDSKNLEYTHLFSNTTSENNIRIYLIDIAPGAHRKPISTSAHEVVFVLDGKLNYQIKKDIVALSKGDLLFFDGSLAHGLSNTSDKNASLLKIYLVN